MQTEAINPLHSGAVAPNSSTNPEVQHRHRRRYLMLSVVATVLTVGVVLLGAYVRLSDAGLGCPDWPGCYGHLDVPQEEHHITAANAAFPERPVDVPKAWKEMIHRYFAGALGLVVLGLAVLAWRYRRRPGQPVLLPTLLLGLIIFQSLLGMWTVTLQLKPVIVMAHLLGGFATLSLLWLLCLRQSRWASPVPRGPVLHLWGWLAMAVVIGQIALGGWVSANYAALACPDFPTCQTSWWPPMDLREGFVLWRGTGVNYEFGVLDNAARVGIHVMHRLGAVVVMLIVGGLCWRLWRTPRLRPMALVIGAVLLIQITLGIANVVLVLPLPVAVAHNGVAALLLLTLTTLNYLLRPGGHS